VTAQKLKPDRRPIRTNWIINDLCDTQSRDAFMALPKAVPIAVLVGS